MKKFICLVKKFDGGYPFKILVEKTTLNEAEKYLFANYQVISIIEIKN